MKIKALIILTVLLFSILVGKSQISISLPNHTLCQGSSIIGSSTTTPQATSWLWHFGDGNTSILENPVHTYQTAGIFTGKLIASDGISTDSVTFQANVKPSPNASFGYSTSNGTTVTLSDSSTISSGPFFWIWDFGDGNSSFLQNPSHTYSSLLDSCYDISLQVYTPDGCANSLTKESVICISDIEELKTRNINIFPSLLKNNAANIKVTGKLNDIRNIVAYDGLGRSTNLSPLYRNDNEITLKTNKLSKGNYILKLFFKDGNSITKKIVIQ